MISDKRKSVRRPMRYTAWIAEKGKPLHGCALADISEKGARLDVESSESVPDKFMLFLSSRGSPRRKCRVAWRTETQVGVRFDQALPKREKSRAMVRVMIASSNSVAGDPPNDTELAEPEKVAD